MKKLLFTLLISIFLTKGFAQSSEIKPNQGISVPQFTTAFITAMTTQPKGTVVFDSDLNVMKYFDGTTWQSMSGGGGGYEWTTNGIDILNTNAGNVGIGTANPIYSRLQINGGVGASAAMFGADKTGVSINADNPEVGLNYFFNGTTKTIKAGYAVNIGMYPNTGDFYIGNFNGNVSNADFGDIVGYQNVMTIKQNGNVGIGTTSPYNKFEVYGNSYLSGTSILSSPTNISAIVSNAADDGAIKIYSPNGFAGSKYITIDKESIQARRTSNAFPSTMSEQNLKLNPFGGNVGIGTGTTALTYKLEVNGTARTKEVIVETGWADYVFEEDYKLKSIDELEVFVKENKHLPNIPKASEIETNGLKVGETNKAMMEKIEELALYIIQLKKEIDVLKSKK